MAKKIGNGTDEQLDRVNIIFPVSVSDISKIRHHQPQESEQTDPSKVNGLFEIFAMCMLEVFRVAESPEKCWISIGRKKDGKGTRAVPHYQAEHTAVSDDCRGSIPGPNAETVCSDQGFQWIDIHKSECCAGNQSGGQQHNQSDFSAFTAERECIICNRADKAQKSPFAFCKNQCGKNA